MKNQLQIGIRIEKKEHSDILPFIKNYHKKNKSFPSENIISLKIAKSHLKERPKYYTKLKGCGL